MESGRSITPNQWTILERLHGGARWSRSFQAVKPLLLDLCNRGFVTRCKPPQGRGNNMVCLTVAGTNLLMKSTLDDFAQLLADGYEPEAAALMVGEAPEQGPAFVARIVAGLDRYRPQASL